MERWGPRPQQFLGNSFRKSHKAPGVGRDVSLFLGDLKRKGKWVYSPDRLFLLKFTVEARGYVVKSLDTFTPPEAPEAPRGVSSPQPDAIC